MTTFNSPGDSIITSGGNIVGVDLVRKDVPNSNQGGNTIVYEGYTPEACTLSEITVFMKTLNTQGTYTATFTNVTTGNTVLSTANFNMQTLSANTWTTLTLTGTASDLSFAADDRFTVSFASNNTSFDGAGVYFTMRFTAASSFTPRAMDLLFSTTLTSSAASINTGTLPTGYKSYHINFNLRTDRNTFHVGFAAVYFNNDLTHTNYQTFRIDGASSRSSPINIADAAPAFISTPGAAGDANFFGGSSMKVHNPESTTAFKAFSVLNGAHTKVSGTSQNERLILPMSGVWRNQSPITSIQIVENGPSDSFGGTADLEAGSSVQVYGLR